MLDVAVYVSSVATPLKAPRKIQCLESFAVGAQSQGAKVELTWEHRYIPARLAVMLGWATTNTGGRNITLRKQVIAEQARNNRHTMCIDASCFKYLDDYGTYLRYSVGGPFYDRANYLNHNSDNTKWQEIQRSLNIRMSEPRTHPNGYILICMQRDGGFAMKTLDPMQWLRSKIQQIRGVTTRHVMIRPHPGQYNMRDFEDYTGKMGQRLNCTVLEPQQSKLIDNLRDAHSAVYFNSSASVAAVLSGVPIFVDDQSCVSWAVSNHDISQIERPRIFDSERNQWIQDLAAAHWSDDDGRSGKIYQKFRSIL